MKRILILGSGGAGKSTLARELGTILDLPILHLDQLFWHSGWVETPREQWIKKVQAKIEKPEWIMDGNYSNTLDIRLAACDTVIFLNMSRWICLRRVLRRSFQYRRKARPDMAEGCPEKLDIEYFKFLKWIWNYPKENLPGILKMCEGLKPSQRVIVLSSPHQVEVFLEVLKASTARRS